MQETLFRMEKPKDSLYYQGRMSEDMIKKIRSVCANLSKLFGEYFSELENGYVANDIQFFFNQLSENYLEINFYIEYECAFIDVLYKPLVSICLMMATGEIVICSLNSEFTSKGYRQEPDFSLLVRTGITMGLAMVGLPVVTKDFHWDDEVPKYCKHEKRVFLNSINKQQEGI